MILKSNQKYIDMSCVRHLLATGEKNADYLTFEISKNYHNVDLSKCTFILRAVKSTGNLVEQTLKKQTDNNSIFLTWTVDEYFTAVSGVLKLEIRGVKGDELVIKYDLSDIIVHESTVGEGLPEIPDTSVIQGEKGDDGFSPTIEFFEDTENSYRLLIINKTNTFETQNLKGLNDVSSGESLKVTTLFDSSDHEKYKDLWSFRCSHWDDRIFSFNETATKNTAFCNGENDYSMRFSNSFGWGANVTAVCSETVEINDKSVLIVNYNCSSDGDGMTAEIIPESDFTSQKTADFEIIPAFYAVSTSYLSANFKPVSALENGNYYIRLKVSTTNPTFTIRKILVISG